MNLLSPLALVWLGAVPVLVWLWRLSATRHQTRVPSLIPFEHLLKRQARRRTHVIVNLLFWLQLVALIGLILALSQPVLFQRRAKVTLIVVDTSASMGASQRGSSAFERAKRALISRLAHKAPMDQVFLMATSPVTAVTPRPVTDTTTLIRALDGLRVSDLGGNLSTTARIGRALLGVDPEETVVITDEPPPAEPLGEHVRWVSVGGSLPNVAILGVDARGPLCSPSDARVLVTVQNFSNDAAHATLHTIQDGRSLGETRAELAPHARQTVALTLPERAHGTIEIVLNASSDALTVDDRAWIQLAQGERLPIVIAASSPTFTQTISAWLSACPSLTGTVQRPSGGGPYLLVTDQPLQLTPAVAGAMVFLPPPSPEPVLGYWMASTDHPISAYLSPIDAVTASLNLVGAQAVSGTPVISALVRGRNVPVVLTEERESRRVVSMLFDPVGHEESTPILIAFFNSLRWLMGEADMTTTGETLTVPGFAAGTVTVRRPDGATETVETEGGLLHYEATTRAGVYRLTQGSRERALVVNFFDPLESNTLEHASTWHGAPARGVVTHALPRAVLPLTNTLLLLLLLLLLAEWWRYSVQAQSSTTALPAKTLPRSR